MCYFDADAAGAIPVVNAGNERRRIKQDERQAENATHGVCDGCPLLGDGSEGGAAGRDEALRVFVGFPDDGVTVR